MRHKLRVANYMFRSQEHSFTCQPPGGLGSATATGTYLLGEKKVLRQLALSCNQRGVEGHSPQFHGLAAAGEGWHRAVLEKAF